MPQPAPIIDAPVGQTVVFGSKIINFDNRGPLVAEDIEFHFGLRSFDSPNYLGQTEKSVYASIKGTGTMTIQLKDGSSFMAADETFFCPTPADIQIPCVVTDVGDVFTQGGAAKIKIVFAERLSLSPLPKIIRYDGDYSIAKEIGNMRQEHGMYNGHQVPGLVYRQTYQQLRGNYSPLAIGSICPVDANAFLIYETIRESVGIGDIYQWDRVWANTPTPIVNYEIMNYPYQRVYQTGAPPVWNMFSYSFTRKARIFYTFHRSSTGDNIPVNRLPRAYIVNGALTELDGFFNVNPGQNVIAADDELELWENGIWIRIQRSIVF